METREVLLRHVCPGLGGLIAFVMFASPYRQVAAVNRAKSIGDVNALPFMAMVANCFSWIIYGFISADFYVYIANMPGVLFGMYFVFVCYKFSKEAAQDTLRNIFLAFACLFFLVGLADLAAGLQPAQTRTMWGAVCVSVLAVYYVAPLSTVARVIAQRDSSSLHWPLSLMNVINGMLWFAYGLALRDYFIALPNGAGAALNLVCLAFCFFFPAKGRSRLAAELAPPDANWGALRLQSARWAPGQAPRGGQGFFDVSQMRWRAGPGSFFRRFSGSRLPSFAEQPGAEAAAAAAAVPCGGGLGPKQGSAVVLLAADSESDGSSSRTAKAGVADMEGGSDAASLKDGSGPVQQQP